MEHVLTTIGQFCDVGWVGTPCQYVRKLYSIDCKLYLIGSNLSNKFNKWSPEHYTSYTQVLFVIQQVGVIVSIDSQVVEYNHISIELQTN